MANNVAVSVTADIADLTAKMAVAKATMQDVGKTMREVARDVAAGDTTEATRTRLLQVSEAYSHASNEAASYARQMRTTRVANDEVGVSAGQQRFAMRDLASQMQDLGVGFSSAAASAEPMKVALMTLTQQSSQVIQAIQLMRGEAGGFIGFLGGPWGAAIMAAVSILANLALAHASAGKAADDQESSVEALGKAIDILRQKSIDATASIEDGIRASMADAFAKRRQAEDTLKAAEAELALRRAKAASAGASVSPGAPSYSNLFNVGAQAAQNALADQQQKNIDALRATIGKSSEAVRGFQADIAKIHIEQSFNAGAAATARYSQRVSDAARAYREGTISLQQYADAVRSAKAAEEKEQAAAKEHKTKPRDTSKSDARKAAAEEKRQEREAEEQARAEIAANQAANQQIEQLAEDRYQTETEISKVALRGKLADIEAEQRARQISSAEAIRQKAAVDAQMDELDQQLQARQFLAKIDQLKADRTNYASGTAEYERFTRQIELLQQQHLNRMRLNDAKAQERERLARRQAEAAEVADLQRTEERKRAIMARSVQPFAANIARMLTLQQGFTATVQGLWQSIGNIVAGVIEQMLTRWIVAQLIKIGLIRTEHNAGVQAQVALAGAGGVASMAAAPFPINTTAPAFGAAMAAVASSFGAASAEDGWDVPGGGGAGLDGRGGRPAIIHPREMVLPAALADTVRALPDGLAGATAVAGSLRGFSAGVATVSDGGIVPAGSSVGARGARSGSGPRMRGGSGGVHVHLHGTVISGPRELRRFAEGNAAQLTAAVKKYARNGGR